MTKNIMILTSMEFRFTYYVINLLLKVTYV